ncbi:helix-turn-helix transcriptional regulator [Streptomyces wuyuanensis]|uniref:helix-turn-helix transcriptional regulator n=1 Tax=Streptomyces wuyuanensis TaxID=1196353 RepID=UPI00342C73EC
MARTFSGVRFRTARHAAGLTADDVAARIGRTRWSVWCYERGTALPSIPIADALADAVGRPLNDFLADDSKVAA